MNVWQRLVQLGQLRDLVVISGSLTHLRYSQNAVAQYLTDHLSASADGHLISSRHLDLWQLTEAEINQTLGFVDRILCHTTGITSRDERFATELSSDHLKRLVTDAFAQIGYPDGDDLPTIRVAQEPARILLKELAVATGASASGVTLRPLPTDGAVSLSISLDAAPASQGLTANVAAGLLTAYLLAYHHGGCLQLKSAAGQYQYVVVLPVEPTGRVLEPPQPGWLDSLLVRLEGWD